ncbi:MAG: tripartite tricarboxylate transporter TctB family protein [Rubrivivax sp.]|jgi:hypothetical protein|nr:tripartite tricarboxylate transporter TctB family protein [Rubrivivax sp.]
MSQPEDADSVGTRWPEVAVALALLAVSVLVVTDSVRVGTGWADDGPQSGYFPFYIGIALMASSAWVLVGALLKWRRHEPFAEREQLTRVVVMAIPMAVYLGLIFLLGIYLSSMLLIAYFMFRYGRFGAAITLPVALGVPTLFFLVFERWFLVPLPKGPVEALLGL